MTWSLEEVRFYFCRFAAGGNDALSLAREKSISGTHAGEIVVWQGLFWKAAPEFSVSSLRLILSSSGPKQRPVSGVCFLLKLSPSEPAQSAARPAWLRVPGPERKREQTASASALLGGRENSSLCPWGLYLRGFGRTKSFLKTTNHLPKLFRASDGFTP